MAVKMTEHKFSEAMRPFGGEVLQTSLSHEDERALVEELRAAWPHRRLRHWSRSD
jgi:uncharacterized membrane protein